MKEKKIEDGAQVQNVPSILSKRRLFPGDRVLGIIVVMFFAISMVVVSTAVSKLGFSDGSINNVIKKHIITLCLSIGIILFCYFFSIHRLRKLTTLIFIASLIMTILPYFGSSINDAHRWLDLGFFKFQPSELLKIATVMFLALQLSAKNHMINNLHLLPTTLDVRKWWRDEKERKIIKEEILPIVLPIALPCIVILPAHTSSAIHIFLVALVLFFVAGIRLREICKFLIAAAFIGMTLLVTIGRIDTVVERTKALFKSETVDKKSGNKTVLDTERSQMAIQNGGFFGVGAGRSYMRARLTHPESDFLFAIVVEEFGLLLAFVIILLYLWLFFRALRIFEKCEWLYAGLLAVGLALLVTSQGFIHIGVNIGILPETGQNLPFLTQGRTGMFCASIAVGIILGISRQIEQGTLLPPSMQSRNKHI